MRLYEWECKNMLEAAGMAVPKGQLVNGVSQINEVLAKVGLPVAVKAQVLSGKRMKNGLIGLFAEPKEAANFAAALLGKQMPQERIEQVLVERRLNVKAEYYLAITYDTDVRGPVLLFSRNGGVDVEELAGSMVKVSIDPLTGLQPWEARTAVVMGGVNGRTALRLVDAAVKMWQVFVEHDCRFLEVNPLVENEWGDLYAADGKAVLDDDAAFRHTDRDYCQRGDKKLTERQAAAKEIDRNDHRGTAGSAYIEMDGDIAVLASGGGASIVCMDALLAVSGRPANYTEYSGDPPAEKVEKLTKIVLSKPGLHGCWVVGGTANFTDIYETLRGFLNGLRAVKPDYPIVVRRAGPRDEEAFDMLRKAAREEGFNLHLYGSETSMTATAGIMVELARKHREGAA